MSDSGVGPAVPVGLTVLVAVTLGTRVGVDDVVRDGRDLAQRWSEAAAVFQTIDDGLGKALSELCWEGPEADLRLTENTQPALLAHSAAAWAVLSAAMAASPIPFIATRSGRHAVGSACGALDAAANRYPACALIIDSPVDLPRSASCASARPGSLPLQDGRRRR